MPPFGGDRYYFLFALQCQQNCALSGCSKLVQRHFQPSTGIIAEMTRRGSKLGKTTNSIHPDSRDSCHGVSLTLG
ncbi:hypothetical protein IE4803_CH00554 [Rhizobium etli bv. phaseoli str. IE4803]|uniref:Uncharacterized protein n=1 Tax=Rhizobium etli bv. mimosae str. IE4771 TaxID=1432050 RepID=A0A060HVY4_RHIET|nr:hypothetical protein IE4771_CH00583 [Rhizobium sp. IE4771]AJC77807.1 hypothetical protein IE4803_CH00554 [Rhizobium etli bv. phaseoli str. IE4803]